jgi:SAM-dependent methyltransferase
MKSQIGLTVTLLKQGCDPGQILVKLALRKVLLGCKTVLDIGCGAAPTLRQLGVSYCVGLEGYRPEFENARRLNTQDEIICDDLRNLTHYFKPGQFDACIAMDVIEHLPKEDGLKLMSDMELIAKRKVVFFTPNGFLPQKQAADSDLQAHFSGWEVGEMKSHGYDVLGMLGPKSLRGEYHMLKHRPKVFWGMISTMDQIFRIHRRPEKAAAILCTKSFSS